MYVLMFVAPHFVLKAGVLSKQGAVVACAWRHPTKKHPNLYGFGMEVFQGPATTSWYGSFLKNNLAF